MEAATLKKTKGTISKGKIKKTIKNVICRPDPAYWPAITDSEKNSIEKVLVNYRVESPNFTKPHWNEIKSIPKSERPKPPPVRRVDGLLFGLSECRNSIENEKCSAVIIEALMNPQTIVQPCITACLNSKIPVICLENLKILSRKYFGIQTSCLGVKKDCLLDLSNKILEISQHYKPKIGMMPKITTDTENLESVIKKPAMEVDIPTSDPYIYRTNKKTRVFVPSKANVKNQIKENQFSGQEFIKIGESEVKDSKTYMRMMLKKISNNPNRLKRKC